MCAGEEDRVLEASVFSCTPVHPQQRQSFTPTTFFLSAVGSDCTLCVKFSRSLMFCPDICLRDVSAFLQQLNFWLLAGESSSTKNKGLRVQQKMKILQQ